VYGPPARRPRGASWSPQRRKFSAPPPVAWWRWAPQRAPRAWPPPSSPARARAARTPPGPRAGLPAGARAVNWLAVLRPPGVGSEELPARRSGGAAPQGELRGCELGVRVERLPPWGHLANVPSRNLLARRGKLAGIHSDDLVAGATGLSASERRPTAPPAATCRNGDVDDASTN
jgi:hypothetical protein